MSESQTTSSTAAAARTSTQSRLRSFGTPLQSVDPSSGIINAFADVFAQIAAIESPQNQSNVSAQAESKTQTESSSQNDDNDETKVRESNDSDEVNSEKQEVDPELAAIAIASEQSEAETETVDGDNDDVVADSEASDDKNASDTPAIAAAAVQVKSEASEPDDEAQLNTSEDADIVKVDLSSEQELKQQKSSDQDGSTPSDPLVRAQSGKQDAAESSEDAATTTESLSTDATSEPESESNSGDHRRDSRERPRNHFGPVDGGDQSSGGTSGEAASTPRSGQAASPSATATLPIPESLTSVEPTTTPTANVSPAAQQAVEAITQTAAAAAGAARTTASGNASSATSTNSAARDSSGAISGTNANTSAADATTKQPEKSGNSSTTDLISRAKLIQRVSRAFQHLGPDGGNVRLRLAPAELGTVRLEMQIRSNKIQTRVVAETEAAAAALRENLPELRARLQSQGMQIEQLSVEVEKDPQADERSFSGHQSGAEQGGAGYSGDRWQSPRQSPRPRPTQELGTAAGRGQINTPQVASQSTGVDVQL